jgi:hypothetical protein
MSTYDLAGTIYKLLPEAYANACAERMDGSDETTIDRVSEVLGFDAGTLTANERLGRYVAHLTFEQAAAMVSEWGRMEREAEPAKRTGKMAA